MSAQRADLLAALPLAQACALLDVGRGSYYRAQAPREAEAGEGATANPDPGEAAHVR